MAVLTQSFSGDNYAYDNLLSGSGEVIITNGYTILAGVADLQRGTVMGRITASGKLRPCLLASADGSQVPFAILAEFSPISLGDQIAPVYLGAQVNPKALIGYVASMFDALRSAGIFVKSNLSAAGVA
jgi:hypothetical protein